MTDYRIMAEGNYKIGLPLLMDKDYNALEIQTKHTLKDNGDGTYRYIKYICNKYLKIWGVN